MKTVIAGTQGYVRPAMIRQLQLKQDALKNLKVRLLANSGARPHAGRDGRRHVHPVLISGYVIGENAVGNFDGKAGRSEWIRTTGPCVPNTVLYQAELHSEGRAL